MDVLVELRPFAESSPNASGPLADRRPTVERFANELRRMSSHRDDETAIAALAAWETVNRLGEEINAQAFPAIYCTIRRAELHSIGIPVPTEWRRVRRLAEAAFEALLWQWRARATHHAVCRSPDGDQRSVGHTATFGGLR